jgi:ABC-type nitrate/sulfonate/bicarbonate transport system permease component
MTWRARLRARLAALALEFTVPLGAVALLAAWTARQDSYLYPSLRVVLATFTGTWLFERVGSDVFPSLVRMGIGFTVAVTGGVAVGLPLGRMPRLRRAATPIIEFLRAIPPPALLPFAIVVVGVGDGMKSFVIAAVCVWPVLLNTIDGTAGLDPILEDTMRVYHIRRRDRLVRVLLPAAAPQIFAGVRLAVSLALIMMVISEMVASSDGIGFFILQSQRTFAIPEMWSGILVLGILGYALNGAVVLVERRLLRWHRGRHASALAEGRTQG